MRSADIAYNNKTKMKTIFKEGQKVNVMSDLSFVGLKGSIVRTAKVERVSKSFIWISGLGKNPSTKYHASGKSIGGGDYYISAQ